MHPFRYVVAIAPLALVSDALQFRQLQAIRHLSGSRSHATGARDTR